MAVDCGRDVNVVEARLANAAAGFHRAAACDTPGGSMVIFRSHGRNPMAVGCGREVNVVDSAVRGCGRGFPPRGCVRHARREYGDIPQPWEESHGRCGDNGG